MTFPTQLWPARTRRIRRMLMMAAICALSAMAGLPTGWAQQSSGGSALRKSTSSARVTRAKKPSDRQEQDEEKPCPNPWPELTEEQQAASLAKQKKLLDSLPGALKLASFPYAETPRFLFATDLPPQLAAPVLPSLEAMYKELCNAFGVDKNTNIWRGKAVIVAFARRETFQQFELTLFHEAQDTAQGLAHQASNGEMLISCYYGSSPSFFPVVIVHETTHGFMHRYRSAQHIPSWINEGAADWVAGAVVRNDNAVRRRQAAAVAQIWQTRSLGGEAFLYAEQVHGVQYGTASKMTEFLLSFNPKAYRKFINGIKDGQTWQVSLKENYGFTPEQLAFRFGQYIGVPGVTP